MSNRKPLALNMNDRVRVTLTPTGRRLLAEYYSCGGLIPPDLRRKVPDDGVVETQLWELFRATGAGIYMGMPEVPFVANRIEVLR